MLDFNFLLLLVACLSPLLILARTWKRAALNRGWQGASVIVLVVAAVSWWTVPGKAGYIAAGVWFLLLFLPAVALRKASDLALRERWSAVRRIVAMAQFLHPVPAVRDELRLVSALECAQKGETSAALAIIEQLDQKASRAGGQAIAQQFRIRGDWRGLLAWCRQHLPLVALGRDPSLLPLYLRALGECGLHDELVLQFAGRAPALLASSAHQSLYDVCLMLVLAFGGRTKALERLLKNIHLEHGAREFWIATSEVASGATEAGRERLERLREKTRDALLRQDIAQRFSTLREDAWLPLAPETEASIRRFERNLGAPRGTLLAPQGLRPTRAVGILIALNVAMFLVEMGLGGATNYLTLHQLGALEPYAVLARGEYWRLFATLFLHYGALHLLFNCYALYVLGPPLESSIGAARFTLSYIVAGIGSSVGVVLLWHLRWTEADFLVGASGSVMGIVGAWAGWLLRHHDVAMARARLFSVALIIAMQTAFDFYTPQVSMAAHLCGLGAGFVVGLLIKQGRRRAL